MNLLFVHGINVREKDYRASFEQVSRFWKVYFPTAKMVPCFWGHLGAKLHANGASIPGYATTGGENATSPLAHWDILSIDPYFSLRLVAIPPDDETLAVPTAFGMDVASGKQKLANALKDYGPVTLSLIMKAYHEVDSSKEFARASETASIDGRKHSLAFSRSVVALARWEASAIVRDGGFDSQDQWLACCTLLDDEQCEQIAATLSGAISRPTLGLKDWLGAAIGSFAYDRAMPKRGAWIDSGLPLLDTIVYGARGEEIRSIVEPIIQDAEGPLLIVGHSLGSVICFDVLVQRHLANVAKFVSVGSPVPFLYELDALHSLRYSTQLPEWFPKWKNFYDERDLVSGMCEPLFGAGASDVKVESKLRFPASHSAYWTNKLFWKSLVEFCNV